MAGMQSSDEALTEINIVPLVDIVLVLLIIFMVTANFIVKPAIDLELPKADTGDAKERNQFSLILGKDGSIGVGENVFANEREALDAIQAEYDAWANSPEKEENRDITMIVQADALVSHGRVIHFIDEARKIGIVKYAFNVDPSAAAEAPVSVEDLKDEDKQEDTPPPAGE